MSEKEIGARWEEEGVEALAGLGFEIQQRAGVSDYQGWCSLLGKSGDESWAVLSWYYGSCSGCDEFEDMERSNVVAELGSRIERFADYDEAVRRFSEGKSW